MVATNSTMVPLGTKAADFQLPDTTGKIVKLSDFDNQKALLIVFMCNHCPFVVHIREGFVQLVKDYQKRGVGVVGINSNDTTQYPDDSPERMAEDARDYGYTFDYLFDETQQVAKAYGAVCTPDFFLFDADHKLVYRGQMDDSRPNGDIPVTGADLRAALDAVLKGRPVPAEQRPSIGCNIKWRS